MLLQFPFCSAICAPLNMINSGRIAATPLTAKGKTVKSPVTTIGAENSRSGLRWERAQVRESLLRVTISPLKEEGKISRAE